MEYKKQELEYLRAQAKQKFDRVRGTWLECGRWALPHKTRHLHGTAEEGARNNYHIVDPTHLLALRSYVAGFLEGNTSASRPWFRLAGQDAERNLVPENREWLDIYTRRTLACLSTSNFYNAAGAFYYEYGVFNTGAYYIDEIRDSLYFHNLDPGAYYVLNDNFGRASILIREFQLTVKALVDAYGERKNGKADWSNFSYNTRKMYEDGNYSQKVDVVVVCMENKHFDASRPQALDNKKWVSIHYEAGSAGRGGQYYQDGQDFGAGLVDEKTGRPVYLRIKHSKRKPFIVGRSDTSGNFEYGEKGPTLDALGLIKSLNKKAISQDQALEQMLRPALQGPANLKKSYITSAANSYVPLDPTSIKPGAGLRPIFEVNPAIAALTENVQDLRQLVDKLYYADYLLFLSRNPKTRTATETNAVLNEQQLIIGPNLQSLNWSHNEPVVDYVMDFVLDQDPHLPPPPEGLAGQFMRTEFISVFAQAQKAADLPAIDRFVSMVSEVGQLQPKIWDKVNLDRLADLYEDRLYLPAGLNNPQAKVDAMREQAMAQAQQQQMLQETLPAMAGAAKDVGLNVNNNQ
jgi:hypothetical protein